MEDKKKCKSSMYVLEPLQWILTSNMYHFIACCKCPGTCNTKHCPCQKDNSSCGAHCGCSSDKCMNRKKRPNILNLNFFTPPPPKRSRSNAPSILLQQHQIITMQTVLVLAVYLIGGMRIPSQTK